MNTKQKYKITIQNINEWKQYLLKHPEMSNTVKDMIKSGFQLKVTVENLY